MKTFIIKTILSIIVFAGIIFVSHFILGQVEKVHYMESSSKNSLSIIGNSHPKCAINDGILSQHLNIKCKNNSVNGQAMFWSIIGGRKLCHEGLSYVVIELSNNTYTNNWKATVKGRAVAEIHKKYFLKKHEWFELAKTDFPLSLQLFTTQVLPRKRVRGEYFKNKGTFIPKLVNENNTNAFDFAETVDFNDDIIHDLILENPKTSFFIIRAPQHPLYYEVIAKENEALFLKKIKKFKKHENCRVMDFGHLYDNNELFGDLEHMNHYGADKFTQILADSLVNYLNPE